MVHFWLKAASRRPSYTLGLPLLFCGLQNNTLLCKLSRSDVTAGFFSHYTGTRLVSCASFVCFSSLTPGAAGQFILLHVSQLVRGYRTSIHGPSGRIRVQSMYAILLQPPAGHTPTKGVHLEALDITKALGFLIYLSSFPTSSKSGHPSF